MTSKTFVLHQPPRRNYLKAITIAERAFRHLEKQIPPPKGRLQAGQFVYRYEEKDPVQAILAKLARSISGLKALDVLLDAGLYQEAGAIQRILEDINEDILCFIAIQKEALEGIVPDSTPLKRDFLRAFWDEEFDHSTALEATQSRPVPRRAGVRAYSARALGLPDPSFTDKLGRTIHSVYSGFVHAASPHIMDMIDGGDPPRYILGDQRGTLRMISHVEDAANYFLRGLYSCGLAAKAFGDQELFDALQPMLAEFEAMLAERDQRDGGN